MSALRPPEDLALHLVYHIANTMPRVWPYKHLITNDFLPPELFDAMMAAPAEAALEQRFTSAEAQMPSERNRFVIHIHNTPDTARIALSCCPRL